MTKIYLNDPYGLKDSKLSGITVSNPEQIAKESASFICTYLIKADEGRIYFAQNLTTHLAFILSLIKSKKPTFKDVYLSDHEMAWIKKMLENKNFQPDATHSNYHGNERIISPDFNVKVFPFDKIDDEILKVKESSIFFISHISRMTGDMLDIEDIFRKIKENNPGSILIIDGSQALGAIKSIDVNKSSDVYLSLSSKFIGAEPHLGLAFLSDSFDREYLNGNKYLEFSPEKYSFDLYYLRDSLQNYLYKKDYFPYIQKLKRHAVDSLKTFDEKLLVLSSNQAPNFLTLNFGSLEKNKKFVDFANKEDIILSENTGWSIVEPIVSLVRIGLSVRVREQDIDVLVKKINKYIKI